MVMFGYVIVSGVVKYVWVVVLVVVCIGFVVNWLAGVVVEDVVGVVKEAGSRMLEQYRGNDGVVGDSWIIGSRDCRS